jgi:thioredoxin-dependent adenylylsulfate APS reductase
LSLPAPLPSESEPDPDRGLEAAALRLEGQPPERILAVAAARFAPRIAFATGFGAEGCVLLDMIGRHRLPIDVFTLDTGLLFPETYELWRRLEARYRLRIRAVRSELDVVAQAALHGDSLWARDPDACCGIRKVAPLRAALSGLDAWITAVRRDQTPDRARVRVLEHDARFGLVKVNPLASWTHEQVWDYVRAHDVPVSPLYARGYPSIGCWPCTSPVAPGEDPRAGRWRGRSKKECGLHARGPLPSLSDALTQKERSE